MDTNIKKRIKKLRANVGGVYFRGGVSCLHFHDEQGLNLHQPENWNAWRKPTLSEVKTILRGDLRRALVSIEVEKALSAATLAKWHAQGCQPIKTAYGV